MGPKVPHKDTAPVKYAEAAKLHAGVKVSSVSTPQHTAYQDPCYWVKGVLCKVAD
jgi:hypothetical protein